VSKTIVFICTGNTCRSPLAEAGMRKAALEAGLDLTVLSAGLAVFAPLPASDHAREAAREVGLDLSAHKSRPFSREMALASDRIVTMTQKHKDAILRKMPSLEGKVHLLSEWAGEGMTEVEDPAGADLEAYRRSRDQILGYVEKAVLRLGEDLSRPGL